MLASLTREPGATFSRFVKFISDAHIFIRQSGRCAGGPFRGRARRVLGELGHGEAINGLFVKQRIRCRCRS